MLDALKKELALQHDYLQSKPLASVYFGGGTPSLLRVEELNDLFEQILTWHKLLPDAEITLEANPDDLTPQLLADLKQYSPINRFSIGIQSFAAADLEWMNRAHNAEEAHRCIETAKQAGFDNLTIDLIYGAPTTTDEIWADNVQTMLDYGIPHFSAYCLTVEEGTALHHFVNKGKTPPVDEEKAARQFAYLTERATAAGYEHYEISNFAKPGCYARHNTNYWRGQSYLGIGPSAHSFDGKRSRQWNVANNARYIESIDKGEVPFEREVLTIAQRYNEYVMTSLRTQWGCDLDAVAAIDAPLADFFARSAQSFVEKGMLIRENNVYRLASSAKFLADGIAADLFWVE